MHVFTIEYNLDDFLYVAGVINSESSGKRRNEVLGRANAVNNEAAIAGRTLREQVDHYSSVPGKKKISKTSNGENAVGVRAAVIDILSGGIDVSKGGTHWD